MECSFCLRIAVTRLGALSVLAFALAMGCTDFDSGDSVCTPGETNACVALGRDFFFMLSGERVHLAQPLNESLGLAMLKPVRCLADTPGSYDPGFVKWLDRSRSFSNADRDADALDIRAELRVLGELLAAELSTPSEIPQPGTLPSWASRPSGMRESLRSLRRDIATSDPPTSRSGVALRSPASVPPNAS